MKLFYFLIFTFFLHYLNVTICFLQTYNYYYLIIFRQTHSYLSNIKKEFKNDKSASIESLEETMKHENQDETIERDENLKLDRHLNF